MTEGVLEHISTDEAETADCIEESMRRARGRRNELQTGASSKKTKSRETG